jgi:glycosyltransferase involved in cell wall biosynthesis
MIYLAYFVIAFTALQLLVSIINLLFCEKLKKEQLKYRPLISVLIPARNEEENIKNILEDLLIQDYGNIEVLVVNDQSDDRTAEIVRDFINRDKRISLINSKGLPQGWLGKNYACHSLSLAAKGEFLIFLDADVRVSGGIITNSLGYALRYTLSLISIFPKQIMNTFGERITVPNMNYILLSLLPLVLVRKSGFHTLAAANGQFMFFNSAVYKSIYPHKLLKNKKVEDIETARLLKTNRLRVACLTGDETIRCRMYFGFKDAVNGFSKNVSAFFANSILLSLLFWITTTLGFIFVLVAMPATVFTIYLLAYLAVRILISVISEQNVYLNLLYIIPQQISCGFFIYNAFINKYLKDYQWKGRSIK